MTSPNEGVMLSFMVNMSDDIIRGSFHSKRALLLSPGKIEKRRNALQWINLVADRAGLAPIARDTTVQIYDIFMIRTYDESSEDISDLTNHLLATCCLLLGAKLHDGRTPLTTGSFSQYWSVDDLQEFQKTVLEKVDFLISPQATPTAFVHKLLEMAGSRCEYLQQEEIANSLITSFLEEPESLNFAPSTIAISALMYSFLHLKIDCTEWLNNLPNYVLPTEDGNGAFADYPKEDREKLLDVDGCLQCFCSVMAKRSLAEAPHNGVKQQRPAPDAKQAAMASASPTSVAAVIEERFDEHPCVL